MGFENIYNHKAIVKESANARVNLIGNTQIIQGVCNANST